LSQFDEGNGCTGKQSFESRALAEKIAKRRRRSRDDMRQCLVYKCEFCRKFHIGNADLLRHKMPRRTVQI